MVSVATISLAGMVACAPQVVDQGGSSGEGEKEYQVMDMSSITWTPEIDCGTCHAVEEESRGNAACSMAAHADIACLTCHSNDAGELETVHANADFSKQAKRLKATEVSDEACLSCHDVGEVDANSDFTVSDKNGTAVKPHGAYAQDYHDGKMWCSSCHSMHKELNAEEYAQRTCIGCHHGEVFECGTCHEV